MNPLKMPRLVRDRRRRALKVFLFKSVVCCAVAVAAAVLADAYQKSLKKRGAAELERMEKEMAELFPPSSGVMVELRGKVAEAGRRTREILDAPGYAAPKDAGYLAGTRASGNRREAEGYLSEYKNALERRKTVKENLLKEGDRTFSGLNGLLDKESREWDAAGRREQERELAAAIAHFAEVNGAAIAVPGFWHKALADADAAFAKARAWIEANPSMSRTVRARRSLAEWNGRLDICETELRDCDRAAQSAYESLAGLPFGGPEQIEAAKIRLVQAFEKFDAAVSRAKRTVADSLVPLDGKFAAIAGEIDGFAKELSDLKAEGGDFVDLDGFSRLAEKSKELKASWEESRDGYLRRLEGECGKADAVKSAALALSDSLKTVDMEDDEALQRLCDETGDAIAKMSALELENLETSGVELVSSAGKAADAIAGEIREEVSKVKKSAPDWDRFSSGLAEKYAGLKSDLARLGGQVDMRLSELAISSGSDTAAFVKAFGKAKLMIGKIALDIPAAVRVSNSAEASAAQSEFEKRRSLAAKAGETIDELDRRLDGVRKSGTVSTPRFAAHDFQALVRDRCSWAVFRFGFWLQIPSGGRHKVEILAGKAKGAVYEKNKNARTVELDISAVCGGDRHSASIEFSNKTPTALAPVIAFECDFKSGYTPLDLELALKCGTKQLERTTMTSWNASLLDFEIRVDGKRVDKVFLKEN